jgi:hypothetical protein
VLAFTIKLYGENAVHGMVRIMLEVLRSGCIHWVESSVR